MGGVRLSRIVVVWLLLLRDIFTVIHGSIFSFPGHISTIIKCIYVNNFFVIVGHAQTFFIAQQRARRFKGKLVLRIEDIDIQRCKPHFLPEMTEDMTWFGLSWDEGYGHPDSVGEDYIQSKRFAFYREAWKVLYDRGFIYPCSLSRRDVEHALSAPQETGVTSTETVPTAAEALNIPNEPVFPKDLRPDFIQHTPYQTDNHAHFPEKFQNLTSPTDIRINWRFRVPDYASDDEREADAAHVSFVDNSCGSHRFTAMRDFGDFLVWRLDGYPSYELAVVVDDLMMGISEVVRGQDLLISTARQLLLMQAIFGLDHRNPTHWHTLPSLDASEGDLDEEPQSKKQRSGTLTMSSSVAPINHSNDTQAWWERTHYRIPRYFHAPLMCDETGKRLAKRNFAKSLRNMREEGHEPADIQRRYFHAEFLPLELRTVEVTAVGL